MSALKEKFDQLIEEQEALRAKFQETAQALFKETIKEFFDQCPAVTAVVWTQYTPYFNDGDTCEFSVNSPTFTNASDTENVRWGEYDGEEEDVFAFDDPSWVMNPSNSYGANDRAAIEKAGGVNLETCKAFSSMICSSAMEDVMLAMFDNHVKVVATRDGFDVEDFDHD